MLTDVQEELLFSIRFGKIPSDFELVSKKNNIGLTIIDYEAVRYLKNDEREYFYALDCPKVVISEFKKNYFIFPIPGIKNVSESGEAGSENLVRMLNEYYYPSPPESPNLNEDDEVRFVTRNRNMLKVLENARKVARYNAHILILGESGTGKDVLARYIHRHSSRMHHTMIKVNCAAIPANLLETEMFGYRKGAFTNAYEDRIGKIQLANGSTLFLDEIGDMDLSLQAKLLRVIETGEVDVIGGLKPANVDVRFVTATNKDIRKAIRSGQFREDLYYRLNVVTFNLLPLRDRPEDIPPLFEYFLQIFNRKYGKKVSAPTKAVYDRILSYSWPGNVREFRHFAERLVLHTNQNKIESETLDMELKSLDWQGTEKTVPLEEYINRQEKMYIEKILLKNENKIKDTALELNVSRTTLFRRMKKLGLI